MRKICCRSEWFMNFFPNCYVNVTWEFIDWMNLWPSPCRWRSDELQLSGSGISLKEGLKEVLHENGVKEAVSQLSSIFHKCTNSGMPHVKLRTGGVQQRKPGLLRHQCLHWGSKMRLWSPGSFSQGSQRRVDFLHLSVTCNLIIMVLGYVDIVDCLADVLFTEFSVLPYLF
jgi:hypothetical protein